MQTITLPKGRTEAAQASAVMRALESLSTDKAWRIEIREQKATRSDAQNRFLWGVAYPTVLEAGGEALAGWEAEDLHEYFLGECYGWETLEGMGRKRVRPIRRSSRLSKTEFADYVAFIQRRAAQMGIVIPDPQ
jgi:hypothetical protein